MLIRIKHQAGPAQATYQGRPIPAGAVVDIGEGFAYPLLVAELAEAIPLPVSPELWGSLQSELVAIERTRRYYVANPWAHIHGTYQPGEEVVLPESVGIEACLRGYVLNSGLPPVPKAHRGQRGRHLNSRDQKC